MKIKFNLIMNGHGVISPDYQNKLCGAFYSAIRDLEGYETYHDEKKIHSISQLFGTKQLRNGSFIANPDGDGMLRWIISSPMHELLLNAAKFLYKRKFVTENLKIFDFEVINLDIIDTKMKFISQSPIILKNSLDRERYYYVVDDGNPEKMIKREGKKSNWYIVRDNQKCSEVMINSAKKAAEKLKFDIDPNLKIYFDESYENKKVLPVIVKRDKNGNGYIKSIASKCPIVIEANPQTMNFVYDLGIGHSTGIGFGTII